MDPAAQELSDRPQAASTDAFITLAQVYGPPLSENAGDSTASTTSTTEDVPNSSNPETVTPIGTDPQSLVLLIAQKVTALLDDVVQYKRLLAYRGTEAQQLLDSFQWLLDFHELENSFKRSLIVATQRLSAKSGLYPTCYSLKDVEPVGDHPLAMGSFADIYKGTFRGHIVCMKVIRLYQSSEADEFLKLFSKEAILWGQLSHPNLLPIYGLYRFGHTFCLVSPWMENGDINNYLKHNPSADRVLLALDVAQGLCYLHENSIIHGDLKGPNILVDQSGRACLADFGLSSVSDGNILAWTSHSSMGSKGGSLRWQAPELFDLENDELVPNSTASDVYAWSCVSYEIFTGNIPFAHISRDATVMLQINNGARPTRPLESTLPWSAWGLTDDIWSLMEDCWHVNPNDRPGISQVITRLASKQHLDNRPAIDEGTVSSMLFRTRMSEIPDSQSVAILEQLLDPDGNSDLSRSIQCLLHTLTPAIRPNHRPSDPQSTLDHRESPLPRPALLHIPPHEPVPLPNKPPGHFDLPNPLPLPSLPRSPSPDDLLLSHSVQQLQSGEAYTPALGVPGTYPWGAHTAFPPQHTPIGMDAFQNVEALRLHNDRIGPFKAGQNDGPVVGPWAYTPAGPSMLNFDTYGGYPPAGPPPGWPQQMGMVSPPQQFGPPPPHARQHISEHLPDHPGSSNVHVGDRVDPFMAGANYGPVLDPLLIGVLSVQPKLNPLLGPLTTTGSERPHLQWKMLFDSDHCRRSTDPSHMRWSAGRDEPATYPRVTSLNIVPETFPWMVVVRASDANVGVMCGEVIDTLSADFQRRVSKADFEALSPDKKRVVGEAYRFNRSRAAGVPGSSLLGEGLRRLDFLGRDTDFGGIYVDERVVRNVTGAVPPCTFVLKRVEWYPETAEEVQRHDTLSMVTVDNAMSDGGD